MLLTRASEYAILSLDEMSKTNEPVGASQLAEKLNIPKSFLAKILQNLARASILESTKGAKGGFVLIKKVENISISSIIMAAEGKKPHVFDCSLDTSKCPKGEIGICVVTPFLSKFQNHIDTFLDGLTLKDILDD